MKVDVDIGAKSNLRAVTAVTHGNEKLFDTNKDAFGKMDFHAVRTSHPHLIQTEHAANSKL